MGGKAEGVFGGGVGIKVGVMEHEIPAVRDLQPRLFRLLAAPRSKKMAVVSAETGINIGFSARLNILHIAPAALMLVFSEHFPLR